ncbi:MAG: hypothetical protein KAX13_02490, partial [Candidatus Krumholzibacteria bacterium]|nr:hypothetical protein [Candidatus Krumholzibacteria bacterium]
MKRKLFVGVLCVLIAAGAAAQELPFGAYIALFFDAEHVYNCREDGFGISTVYLFAIPIENGLECVSLQIQEYPPLLSIFDAVYSPELGIPIVGGIPGDLVACYSTCQNTDEWLLIAQFSVFVNSYLETFLGMLPFTGDDYPMMLDCNSSEKPCVIFCGA